MIPLCNSICTQYLSKRSSIASFGKKKKKEPMENHSGRAMANGGAAFVNNLKKRQITFTFCQQIG